MITPENILAVILAIASAIVLLSNATEKIAKAVKLSKTPLDEQSARLDALEKWKEDVDRKLNQDNDRLTNIIESGRITQRAILALLDHGIDGNNVTQMKDARDALDNHLINKFF